MDVSFRVILFLFLVFSVLHSAHGQSRLPSPVQEYLVESGVPQSTIDRLQQQPTPSALRRVLNRAREPHRVPSVVYEYPELVGAQREPTTRPKTRSARSPVRKTDPDLSGYQTIEAAEERYQEAWPFPKLNTVPSQTPQPAGDVDGDGINDWIYAYAALPDERTSDPSDFIAKTFLKFGGGFQDSYYDVLHRAPLEPVGDLNNDGHADAVVVGDDSVTIWTGGEDGYSRGPAAGRSVERGFLIGSSDLDGDGVEDLALYSVREEDRTELDILYGASSLQEPSFQHFGLNPASESAYPQFAMKPFTDGESARIVSVKRIESTEYRRFQVTVRAITEDRAMVTPPPVETSDLRIPGAVHLYDGTGDGRRDVVVTNHLGEVYTFVGEDDGTISPSAQLVYEPGFKGLDPSPVGDLDGNGTIDYVAKLHFVNESQGEYSVFFGGADFTTTFLSARQSLNFKDGERGKVRTHPTFFGDLTGNGRDDVLLGVNGFDEIGPRMVSSTANQTPTTTDFSFDQSTFLRDKVFATENVGDWIGDGTDDVDQVPNVV